MLHCSYDNSTCYVAKTVPVIHSLTTNTGYMAGGVNLTVKGHGFDSGNITAKVGDIPCKITDKDKEFFTCTVGSSPSVSDLSLNYVG